MYGRNFGSVAALCLVALYLGGANATARIAGGGTAINIQYAPYIVQLRTADSGSFCGGTLVSARVVVTAAHCFNGIAPASVVIVAGARTVYELGEQRRIYFWAKHPSFNPITFHADIAILVLDSPMPTNDFIQPTRLCSAPVPANALVRVSGWGTMWYHGASSPDLLSIEVPIMDHSVCQATKPYITPITDTMMCAYANTQATCQGDSGGPVIYNRELCGIVSFGGACGDLPTIYTDVYALRSYIASYVDLASQWQPFYSNNYI